MFLSRRIIFSLFPFYLTLFTSVAWPGPITVANPSQNPTWVNTPTINIQGTSLDPVLADGVLCSGSAGSFSCPVTLLEGLNLINLTNLLPSSPYGFCASAGISLSNNSKIQPLAGETGFSAAALGDVSVQNNAEIHATEKVGGNYTGKNNAKLYGDLYIHGTVTLQNNSAVNGSVTQLPQAPDPCVNGFNLDQALNQVQAQNDNSVLLSNPNIAPYIQNGSLQVTGNNSVTLPAGTFYFENSSLSNNAHLLLAAGARVRIFMRGNLVLENNAKVNDGGNPNQLYLVSGADSAQGQVLQVKNNAILKAVVYAPRADASVSENGALSGGLVCRNYLGSNNSNVYSYAVWPEPPDAVALEVTYLPVDALQVMDSSGGTLQIIDPASPIYRASIQVPPGALAGRTPITLDSFEGIRPEPDTGVFFTGPTVVFGPEGMVFSVPVVVALPYDLSLIGDNPAYIIQNRVRIFDEVNFYVHKSGKSINSNPIGNILFTGGDNNNWAAFKYRIGLYKWASE